MSSPLPGMYPGALTFPGSLGGSNDLLTGLAQWTAAAGLATYNDDNTPYDPDDTGVFFKRMPSDPDRVVVLTPYGANHDHPSIPLGNQMVQVKTRGAADDDLDVDVLADAIFDLWHGATNLVFGSLHIVQILRRSSTPAGMDGQSRRWLRIDNYALDIDYPVTPNRPI
jgi:hypothetical protein